MSLEKLKYKLYNKDYKKLKCMYTKECSFHALLGICEKTFDETIHT